uniref:Uncharacterized protein n=1 Tax=Arundo donax TaxID=35708 RepID=A0A0A9D036_ARUDO
MKFFRLLGFISLRKFSPRSMTFMQDTPTLAHNILSMDLLYLLVVISV